MKSLMLVAVLALLSLSGPVAATSQAPEGYPALTLRITSATRGQEVAVEGFYQFRLGAPKDIAGMTPLVFSAPSEEVLTLIAAEDEESRIQVELLRGEKNPETLLHARGRVVKLDKSATVGGTYSLLAY